MPRLTMPFYKKSQSAKLHQARAMPDAVASQRTENHHHQLGCPEMSQEGLQLHSPSPQREGREGDPREAKARPDSSVTRARFQHDSHQTHREHQQQRSQVEGHLVTGSLRLSSERLRLSELTLTFLTCIFSPSAMDLAIPPEVRVPRPTAACSQASGTIRTSSPV